jgi:Cu(I)/Ag(I) efflux system membrane fusion protein
MKKKILGFVLGVAILPVGVIVAQDHSAHKMDHSGHKMSMNHDNTAVKQYEVSVDFQKQLNAVYKASLEINEALVAEDATAATQAANEMSDLMMQVEMSLLTGDAHMTWMTYMKSINAGLQEMRTRPDIQAQRQGYASVSDGLYKAVKSFGVGETVYYQFCPMAKSSWLNDSEEVNNPYYGGKMLKCGSTKEVLN